MSSETPTVQTQPAAATQPDTAESYLARLKLWALYAAVALVAMLAHALLTRWLGASAPVVLPPPAPIVVVAPGLPGTATVTVVPIPSPAAPKE